MIVTRRNIAEFIEKANAGEQDSKTDIVEYPQGKGLVREYVP